MRYWKGCYLGHLRFPPHGWWWAQANHQSIDLGCFSLWEHRARSLTCAPESSCQEMACFLSLVPGEWRLSEKAKAAWPREGRRMAGISSPFNPHLGLNGHSFLHCLMFSKCSDSKVLTFIKWFRMHCLHASAQSLRCFSSPCAYFPTRPDIGETNKFKNYGFCSFLNFSELLRIVHLTLVLLGDKEISISLIIISFIFS